MRTRTVLGLIAALILVLSSAAPSVLGWKQLSSALQGARVPSQLVVTLGMGWHFGGAAMLAFGVISAAIFRRRFRGEAVSTFPTAVIGVLYVIYGTWALVASGFDPFFAIFIVPGALLGIASMPKAEDAVT